MGFVVNQSDLPLERWPDAARGTIAWKTLISADKTPTDSLICGIAEMQTGDTFALHFHPQPEVYFGLSGAVDVHVDGVIHRLTEGMALFIPSNAVHGVARADQPVRWFYTFAADRFSDIAYTFMRTE